MLILFTLRMFTASIIIIFHFSYVCHVRCCCLLCAPTEKPSNNGPTPCLPAFSWRAHTWTDVIKVVHGKCRASPITYNNNDDDDNDDDAAAVAL